MHLPPLTHPSLPPCTPGCLLCACAVLCRSWAAGEGLIAGPEAPGVRFVFDGEQLPAGDTPAGLDLEGGEIIEVHF